MWDIATKSGNPGSTIKNVGHIGPNSRTDSHSSSLRYQPLRKREEGSDNIAILYILLCKWNVVNVIFYCCGPYSSGCYRHEHNTGIALAMLSDPSSLGGSLAG